MNSWSSPCSAPRAKAKATPFLCPDDRVPFSSRLGRGVRCRVVGRVLDRPSAAVQSLRFSSLGVLSSIRMSKRSSGLRWCAVIYDGVSKPSSIVVKRFRNDRPRICAMGLSVVKYLNQEGHWTMYTPSGIRRWDIGLRSCWPLFPSSAATNEE